MSRRSRDAHLAHLAHLQRLVLVTCRCHVLAPVLARALDPPVPRPWRQRLCDASEAPLCAQWWWWQTARPAVVLGSQPW